MKSEIETLKERLAEEKQKNTPLRLLLFLRHGCHGPALYGDDGEMQCHDCAIDFRRMAPEEIEARWRDIGLRKLAAAAPSHSEAPSGGSDSADLLGSSCA